RLAGRVRGQAPQHPTPFDESVSGHHCNVELAVVGPRVLEHLHATEELAEVAQQDAAGLPLVPGDAVNLDPRLERLLAQTRRRRPDIRCSAEAVLEISATRAANHRGV